MLKYYDCVGTFDGLCLLCLKEIKTEIHLLFGETVNLDIWEELPLAVGVIYVYVVGESLYLLEQGCSLARALIWVWFLNITIRKSFRKSCHFRTFIESCLRGGSKDPDLESGILFLPNRVADSAQTAQCGQSFYLFVWFG